MLGRSRPLRHLFRLSKRSFATESGGAAPPKTDGGVSQSVESGATGQAAKGGSGFRTLLTGAVVAAAGVAVYQNRQLFHEYPIHPVILKLPENLGLTPATEPAKQDEILIDPVAPMEQPPPTAPQKATQQTAPQPKPVEKTVAEPNAALKQETVKGAPKEAPAGETEPIPPQIIDNTAIVELFSEALGQKSIDEGLSASAPSKDITEADVDKLLSLEFDVTKLSGKLLAAALKEAVATQPDWKEFKARHTQALHDASMLKLLLDTERAKHKETVDGLETAVAERQSRIHDLETNLASMKQEMTQKLQAALKHAQEQYQEQLQQVKDKLALEHAEAALQETTQRHRIIDQLREKLNVLTAAVTSWMELSKSANNAQKSAVNATTMDELLGQQDAGIAWIQKLSSEEMKDPTLRTALNCMPQERVASKRELMQKLTELRNHVEALALLPPSGGGLLAQMTARVGAKLKIKVPEAYGDADDVSSQFDQVERALTDGAISKAVELLRGLTKDSAASHFAASWIEDATRYASFQQIRKILIARSQELTLGLAER